MYPAAQHEVHARSIFGILLIPHEKNCRRTLYRDSSRKLRNAISMLCNTIRRIFRAWSASMQSWVGRRCYPPSGDHPNTLQGYEGHEGKRDDRDEGECKVDVLHGAERFRLPAREPFRCNGQAINDLRGTIEVFQNPLTDQAAIGAGLPFFSET